MCGIVCVCARMFPLPLGFQETLVPLLHHKSRRFSSTVPGRFNFPATNSFAELCHVMPSFHHDTLGCAAPEGYAFWLAYGCVGAGLMRSSPHGLASSFFHCQGVRVCIGFAPARACVIHCTVKVRWQSLAMNMSQDVLYIVEPICGSCGLFFLIQSAACGIFA